MGRSALSLEVAGVRARGGFVSQGGCSSRILGPEKVKQGQRKQQARSKQVPAARKEEIPRGGRSDQIKTKDRQRWREIKSVKGESDFEGEGGGEDQSDKPWSGLSELEFGGGDERGRWRGKDNHHFQDKAIQGCT
ncbi:hypothetical protein M752DRAFT_133843 [Aspergillus phoenicis ATCC 13157]|uniref:Uncharacterized protein n=1 Tax=Aspergillus phoenicis ATCC 13157 TaxID=1353007 RepID=A0A370PSL5_ASPPH|nr:hypothetical protein M752DRAFT_133843 [Aspergillus phoenicis ATCC 13157]